MKKNICSKIDSQIKHLKCYKHASVKALRGTIFSFKLAFPVVGLTSAIIIPFLSNAWPLVSLPIAFGLGFLGVWMDAHGVEVDTEMYFDKKIDNLKQKQKGLIAEEKMKHTEENEQSNMRVKRPFCNWDDRCL